MYSTSDTYKTQIRSSGREFDFTAEINTSDGTYAITKDRVQKVVKSFDMGSELELGGVYSQMVEITLCNNNGEYDDVNFTGGTVSPVFYLKIISPKLRDKDGNQLIDRENKRITLTTGTDYVSAYSGAEINAFIGQVLGTEGSTTPGTAGPDGELVSVVPGYTYYITKRSKPGITITITAYDALCKLNLPYISSLAYPATLLQIAQDIASKAGLTLANTNFMNYSAVVSSRPDFTDMTMRQVLGFVAQLAGSYARLNGTDQIDFCWINSTPGGNPITASNCFSLSIEDPTKPISGVIYGDSIIGTDTNAFDLSDNPLLANITAQTTVLNAIYDRVKNTAYVPYNMSWSGDFAYQPGDCVVIKDRDNVSHTTIIMSDTLTMTGGISCSSAAKTRTEEEKGYIGDLSIKTAQIRQQIKELDMKVDGDRTSLETAIESATVLMAGSLGCYTFKKEAGGGWIAGVYMSRYPESSTSTSTEVWLQNDNGFAHYPNGVAGSPDTSITADGTIVAKLVAAGIVTADMIETGILQSSTGGSSFNLNTGTMNLGNGKFNWNGSTLYITGNLNIGSGKLTWNGSTLSITGSITATSGQIGGFTIGTVLDDSSPANTINRLYGSGYAAMEVYNNGRYAGIKSSGGTCFYAGAGATLNNSPDGNAKFTVAHSGQVICRDLVVQAQSDGTGLSIKNSSGTQIGGLINSGGKTIMFANAIMDAVNGAKLVIGEDASDPEIETGLEAFSSDGTSMFYVGKLTGGSVIGRIGKILVDGNYIYPSGSSYYNTSVYMTSGLISINGSSVQINGGTPWTASNFPVTYGTWTPRFTTTNNSGPTYTVSGAKGYYSKMGKIVFVSVRIHGIRITNIGSGYAAITGFPFTASYWEGSSDLPEYGLTLSEIYGIVGSSNVAPAGITLMFNHPAAGQTILRIQQTSGSNAIAWRVNGSDSSAGVIAFSGWYYTNT